MSRLTILSTITTVMDIDVPAGFLVDEEELARSLATEQRASVRASVPDGQKLTDLKVTVAVVAHQ